MKQRICALLCALLCLLLLCPAQAAQLPTAARADAALCAQAGCKAGTLLANETWFPAGSSGSDWMAMALALGGVQEDYDAYLQRLQEYVTACYAKSGALDAVKATEYHRIALTVLALGGDPTAFGQDADGQAVNLIADGTYNFSGELGKQGLNGWIFALITLDAGGYEVPQGARYDRAAILQAILDAQEESGGFGLVRGSADTDITAMALQALAPYASEYAQPVERALGYLAAQMDGDGMFESYGEKNPESACQVLIALGALGIDPVQDARFGAQVEASLDRFALADGSYKHSLQDERGNLISTEQALLAKLALQKLEEGARLYDLKNVPAPAQRSAAGFPFWALAPFAALGCAAIVCYILRKEKKHETDR